MLENCNRQRIKPDILIATSRFRNPGLDIILFGYPKLSNETNISKFTAIHTFIFNINVTLYRRHDINATLHKRHNVNAKLYKRHLPHVPCRICFLVYFSA